MQRNDLKKEKIAIIGSGISGLASAYFLYKNYDITIFEKNSYPGGHINTITVKEGKREIPIDTAVMIYNKANYPYFCRLLKELQIPTQEIDSTISFQHVESGLDYAIPHINLVFAQRKNIFNPSFFLLITEIFRFAKNAREVLIDDRYANITIEEYAKEKKFSNDFLQKYLLPFAAGLWLADQKLIMKFPIVTLVQYFQNHHLLTGPGSDTKHLYWWRSFVGGAKTYRDRLLHFYPKSVHLTTPIKRVKRFSRHVEVTTETGKTFTFDRVILACHADEALALLSDPTPLEKELLGAFYYKTNSLTLHTDTSVMPKTKRAWAAFNCRISMKGKRMLLEQHYYLNQLQKLSSKKDYFLAVGTDKGINPDLMLQKFSYAHPVYSVASAKAQSRLRELNENGRTYFCGSYFRYAFHEDALVSALAVARKITGKEIWNE